MTVTPLLSSPVALLFRGWVQPSHIHSPQAMHMNCEPFCSLCSCAFPAYGYAPPCSPPHSLAPSVLRSSIPACCSVWCFPCGSASPCLFFPSPPSALQSLPYPAPVPCYGCSCRPPVLTWHPRSALHHCPVIPTPPSPLPPAMPQYISLDSSACPSVLAACSLGSLLPHPREREAIPWEESHHAQGIPQIHCLWKGKHSEEGGWD